MLDQVEKQRAPLGLANVERDAALAAIEHLPVKRVVGLDRREPAQRVVTGGELDLDDVGPGIGAQRRGERRGDDGRHVENPQAGERAGGWAGDRRSDRASERAVAGARDAGGRVVRIVHHPLNRSGRRCS